MTELGLAEATARWQLVSPRERLRCRVNLQAVADNLELAAEASALDLDTRRNEVRDHALDLAQALADALELVRSLDHDGELTEVLVNARTAVCDIADQLEGDRAHNCTRQLARGLTPPLVGAVDDRNLRNAPLQAHEIGVLRTLRHARTANHNLGNYLTRARDHARGLGLFRSHERARIRYLRRNHALGFALERVLDAAPALKRELADIIDQASALGPQREFIEARDNLTYAACDFAGADLSTVDLDEVNLAGIRWDSRTQWPTPEWAARVLNASVEDPPGSGVFTVQPEEGHDFTERDSLAPIS